MLNNLRYILGSILIISGYVKLNDPLGFAYKLEEYYAPDVLNIPFLMDYAYANGVMVSYAEVFLGVAIIFGWKYTYALILSILMFVFFAFLTFYSAFFDKVTDCGCFGDAIHFTPWQSFTKDMVLLLAALVLYYYRKDVKSSKYAIAGEIVFGIGAIFLVFYSVIKLPIVDFRPYKIGANIPELMKVPEGALEDVYEDTWVYKVDGVAKQYSTAEEPWKIEGAEYVDRKTVLIQKGYEPPIHDFALEENGIDLTEEVLAMEEVLWIVSKDLTFSEQELEDIKSRISNEKNVILISPSSDEKVNEFVKFIDRDIRAFSIDHTTCKTIIRSNPGFLKVEKGIVIEKYAL